MGVMPLTALRDASAPETADTGATARVARRGHLPTQIRFSIHGELSAVELDWRASRRGDCTVFQNYGWIETWQKHLGARQRVKPAIVVGRFTDGEIAFRCRFASKKNTGCAGWARLARTCATTTRRFGARFFAARRARSLPRHLADFANANAKRSATAPRLDRLR